MKVEVPEMVAPMALAPAVAMVLLVPKFTVELPAARMPCAVAALVLI